MPLDDVLGFGGKKEKKKNSLLERIKHRLFAPQELLTGMLLVEEGPLEMWQFLLVAPPLLRSFYERDFDPYIQKGWEFAKLPHLESYVKAFPQQCKLHIIAYGTRCNSGIPDHFPFQSPSYDGLMTQSMAPLYHAGSQQGWDSYQALLLVRFLEKAKPLTM